MVECYVGLFKACREWLRMVGFGLPKILSVQELSSSFWVRSAIVGWAGVVGFRLDWVDKCRIQSCIVQGLLGVENVRGYRNDQGLPVSFWVGTGLVKTVQGW